MADEGAQSRDGSSVALPDLVRERHDPDRPGINTAEAVKLTGMTRQGVIQAILAGRLAGYALAGPKNLRWFVYRDALAQEPSREKQLEEEAAGIRKRLAAAENTITALRAAQEQRRESLRLYQQSLQKVLSAHADLAEAYQRLATVADAADDELLGNWIQAYPPEES